jgi:hypothetical protein
MNNHQYELCKFCDHFVDPNDSLDDDWGEVVSEDATSIQFRDQDGSIFGLAKYIHLEDGNGAFYFDHDATPSGVAKTLEEWGAERPDLFQTYPDGHIGPNSVQHSMRGKRLTSWTEEGDN